MKTAKITAKLVRSFGVGIIILSPSKNGLCAEVQVACFALTLWSRGKMLFAARNFWG